MDDEDGRCLLDVICDPQALNDFLHGSEKIDSDDLLDNSGDAASAFFEGAGLHGQEAPGNPLSAEPSQPPASVDPDFLEDDILGPDSAAESHWIWDFEGVQVLNPAGFGIGGFPGRPAPALGNPPGSTPGPSSHSQFPGPIPRFPVPFPVSRCHSCLPFLVSRCHSRFPGAIPGFLVPFPVSWCHSHLPFPVSQCHSRFPGAIPVSHSRFPVPFPVSQSRSRFPSAIPGFPVPFPSPIPGFLVPFPVSQSRSRFPGAIPGSHSQFPGAIPRFPVPFPVSRCHSRFPGAIPVSHSPFPSPVPGFPVPFPSPIPAGAAAPAEAKPFSSVPTPIPAGKGAPAPGKSGAPLPPQQPGQVKPGGIKGPPQTPGGGKGPQAPPTLEGKLALKKPPALQPSKEACLLEQLHKHQGAVLHPEFRTPFRSVGDALRRLPASHAYTGEFEAGPEQLLRRTRAMLNKYRLLLLEESRGRGSLAFGSGILGAEFPQFGTEFMGFRGF
ncbi:PREDICTED: glioma tumor suppressor candidate region gene 1 protein [Corvus brachyrhynchos]|uniref:glioma tumor suppressor candidate region gene 1 protein n=1 Tax=Corvus brachyrhynchos TaxID=85066 RepID=UPI0008164A41|nr:PREDICTED: glioma tumor suppressor candidate region gene 1 protein [Corvus brachyrhynchos]